MNSGSCGWGGGIPEGLAGCERLYPMLTASYVNSSRSAWTVHRVVRTGFPFRVVTGMQMCSNELLMLFWGQLTCMEAEGLKFALR